MAQLRIDMAHSAAVEDAAIRGEAALTILAVVLGGVVIYGVMLAVERWGK